MTSYDQSAGLLPRVFVTFELKLPRLCSFQLNLLHQHGAHEGNEGHEGHEEEGGSSTSSSHEGHEGDEVKGFRNQGAPIIKTDEGR